MLQAGQADLLSLLGGLHRAPDLQGGGRNELTKEKLRFSELERQEGSIGRLSWLPEQKASPPARDMPWAAPSATSSRRRQGWGGAFLLLLRENELGR